MGKKGWGPQDDPVWDAMGEPKKSSSPKAVTALREYFWREMDIVPLSVPRWDSQPRINANLRWLLNHDVPEHIIRASFRFFRNDVERLDLSPQNPCWAVYYSRRNRYLDQAWAAQPGSREGEVVHKAGDIDPQASVRKRQRIIRHKEE